MIDCRIARLLALLTAAILVACAAIEVSPDIRFMKISGSSLNAESPAIVGFYSKISEGPLAYNVGVRIISVDGMNVTAWHGVVFESGMRKIVANFEAAGGQRTETITLTLDARPGRRYLVAAADSAPVDKQLTQRLNFWIEDVVTREVVAGKRPPTAGAVDKKQFQALHQQFRTALAAAGDKQ
jgi:hypothetical protein